VRVDWWYGRAVALALLSVCVGGCENPFRSSPDLVDAGALGSAAADPQLRVFYAARGWQAAWNGKSERDLLEALDQATVHGMKRDLFLKEPLPKNRDERDATLTAAALRYASALASGYVDPSKVGRIYSVPRPRPDLTGGLSAALQDGKLQEWLDSLPPQTDEYRALSQAFVQTLRLVNGPAPEPVPTGRTIKPGRHDARLPRIVKALAASGYLETPHATSEHAARPMRYGPPIVTAVKRLQSDAGLKPDGIIGSATIEALNRGPAERGRQLAVNLERLRWLDRNPPATRIDVNTAAAYLDYWRNGRHRDHRRVVVGQPDWETPELGSPILQLVAHPFWRVPDSILEDELKEKSSGWLASQDMEWRDGRLVQLPGPKNSLGEVKFDMRNDQHIYLHDTPAKAVFALPERHRSHGCVRVYDALGFALLLAADDGVLPKFQAGLMEPDESYVKLRTEVPVRLMYRTAFVDNGGVRLVEDIYGWDDDVAYGLGYVRRPPRARGAHGPGADVGP
jgi:murein L,D-transpeptidase YcbB/YkuD